jgi:hypothetical protein
MDELELILNNLTLNPLEEIRKVLLANKNIDPEEIEELMKMIKDAIDYGSKIDYKSVYDWLNNQPVN